MVGGDNDFTLCASGATEEGGASRDTVAFGMTKSTPPTPMQRHSNFLVKTLPLI